MKSAHFSRRRFLSRACMLGAGSLCLAGGGLPFACLEAVAGNGATERQTRLLMGTFVTLAAIGEPGKVRDAFGLAFAEMERLITVFDRHDPASALSVLNSQGRLQSSPAELYAVLEKSLHLGQATDHAFNPAVLPVLGLFERADGTGRLPHFDAHELAEALALAKPGNVSMDKGTIRFNRSGMGLTLDGIAKGYIADAASAMLAARGIDNHMVNAGGDIRVSTAPGQRPWQIGIRHPGRPDTLLASLALSRGGIATSGSYEKNFDRSGSRHHLISHVSGRSPDIRSVSVWARSAMEADALATALSLMPPAEALRHVEATTSAACLIIDRHGRRYASPGWS